jgi:DNA-binding beta-propeller fold protein YncE
MVYDPARKLLFVSVEILNEVLVLSSVDGHEVASIPVNYPAGIDEAANGGAIYVVSPFFGGVTVIDPGLLQVVGHARVPQSVSGLNESLAFFQVAALSSGKVFLLPAAGSAPLPCYLFDPGTNTFSSLGQPSLDNVIGLITRSADHSKVLGGGGILYDATTNTFGGLNGSISAYAAISPDGSRIVSVGLTNSPTELLDSNFNVSASLQLGVFPVTGVVYGLDGRHIYIAGGDMNNPESGIFVTVIDAQTFSVVGVVPSFSFAASLPFSGQVITTFAIDETNMLFGSDPHGVDFLDVSNPTFLQQPLPGSFFLEPQLASLFSPTQATANIGGLSQGLGIDLFFGAPPASTNSLQATNISGQSTGSLNFTIPRGITPGLANVTLTRSDGFFEVMPHAVSFGPTVLRVDADSGSPSGNDYINIVGYGLDSNTKVTIGGRTGVVQNGGRFVGAPGPLNVPYLSVTTPPGVPGRADVTVTNSAGSATISGGFDYLNSVQVYPIVGALDALAYDQGRQLLYVTNEDHNRVEVFNLTTGSFLSPVPVGNAPTGLALTPDATLLAVLNIFDGTVSVLNLTTRQVTATYPALTPNDQSITCGGVLLSLSPVATPATRHRMLLDVNCTNELFGGAFHLLNLDTGSLSCTGVAGCESNGTDISFASGLANMASVPDGTKVFLAGQGEAPVGMLDLIANTLTSGFSGSFSDAAASADGTVFAATFGISDAQLNRTSIMAFERYADSGSQSLNNVIGEKLNASGSLLFFPQHSGVDIFDVHTGRLVRHVVLPDNPIPLDSGALVLDETGSKMFLISNSGITIAQLDEVPLSLATVRPPSGPVGTIVKLRGSGFQNGATVSIGAVQAATAFVDASTLTVTVPSLTSGPERVTVSNPNGETYTLDDAFTTN